MDIRFNPETGRIENEAGEEVKIRNYKIKKLLEYDCIRLLKDEVNGLERCRTYSIAGIPGYNRQLGHKYIAKVYMVGPAVTRITCNCQGAQRNGRCTHTELLRIMYDASPEVEQYART